jgi:glycosyltransferase involved in cell wall biosynthesis
VNAPRGISVVVPTVGRPSLGTLLAALHQAPRPPGVPVEILVVPDATGAGPATTRNRGWRQAAHEWVAFLDDDVVPDPDWLRRLAADLTVPPEVGGVQGQVRVPLPGDRRPTDWERVTAGLADSDWITADMAYRRAALERVGGFDERFPRAFREDAELAYRVRRAGWELRRGTRTVTHPVRAESRWVSLRTQRGNADDALLRRIYGPRWRDALDVPSGRRCRHAAVVAAGAAALGGVAMSAGTRRRRWRVAAGLAAMAWLAGTAEFAVSRIRPGPRTRREISTMVLSSAIIPVIAIIHWCRGWWRWRSVDS